MNRHKFLRWLRWLTNDSRHHEQKTTQIKTNQSWIRPSAKHIAVVVHRMRDDPHAWKNAPRSTAYHQQCCLYQVDFHESQVRTELLCAFLCKRMDGERANEIYLFRMAGGEQRTHHFRTWAHTVTQSIHTHMPIDITSTHLYTHTHLYDSISNWLNELNWILIFNFYEKHFFQTN